MKGGIQHICMAEDDPDDYFLFSEILHEINGAIKLTWFQTCEDLLEFLKTGSNLPCLIVLDMNMPKMDGQTCLISIKKELELHHIPVIILSTAGHPTTINSAYQAGAFKFYHKPGSIDDFRKIVSEILAIPITRF
jgi:DNA-binding NtrC family response regulator